METLAMPVAAAIAELATKTTGINGKGVLFLLLCVVGLPYPSKMYQTSYFVVWVFVFK
jgi:hypothetical protein